MRIDELHRDVELRFEHFCRFHGDVERRSVGNHSDVRSRQNHFTNAKRDTEITQIRGERLLGSVAIEAFDDQGRFFCSEKGVVHAGGLGHVARDANVHAPERIDDGTHWGTAVPNPLQPMPPCPNDDGGFLPPGRAITDCGGVVTQDLEAVVQIIEVLNFSDGPETAHGEPNALAGDGGFADARVADADVAKLRLHAFHRLVDSANLAGVLAEGHHLGIPAENFAKVPLKDDSPIHKLRLVRVHGRDGQHLQSTVRAIAVKMARIPGSVHGLLGTQPLGQGTSGRAILPEGGIQRLTGGAVNVRTARVHRSCEGGADGGGGGAGLVQQGQNRVPLRFHGLAKCSPSGLLLSPNGLLGLLADGRQVLLSRGTFQDQEIAELRQAVILLGPGHSLW